MAPTRWIRALIYIAAITAFGACRQTTAPRPPATTRPDWVRPASVESIDVPPQKNLTEYRVFGPTLVVGAKAHFVVEAPPSATDEKGNASTPATLALTKTGAAEAAMPPITLSFGRFPPRDPEEEETPADPASQPASRPTTRRHREKPLSRADVDVPAATMVDGTYTATVTIRPANSAPTELKWQFDIDHRLPSLLPPAAREELLAWLEDANAHHPIWGKRPAWTNLWATLARARMRDEAGTGDPLSDMCGLVLRSYFNEQLQRRQPYTVYLPKIVDLTSTKPHLVLLHG